LKSPGVVDSHPLMAVPDLLGPSSSATGAAEGQVAEN